jgi:uncharacterized protein YdeI (YjbR/CyaY-like superfamily)
MKLENKSGIYSYEQRKAELDEPYDERLRQNKGAREFFHARLASYRKAAIWWVLSGKKEETRLARLEKLIELSAQSQRIHQY